jgi:predicted DNA-binding transcriptional regulator YafY
MSAWCELRNGYRNFRVERIQSSTVFDEPSDQDNGRLFRELAELPKVKPTPSP